MTNQTKKNWEVHEKAYHNLLRWLDGDTPSSGYRYLEIRNRLVLYFDRKGVLYPDDLADETLNRVARRLEEETIIESETPAKYCYIVAKFVFLESLRNREKAFLSIDEDIADKQSQRQIEESEIREKRLQCLESCASKLDESNRELIFGYYCGTERVKIEKRKQLALQYGLSANALSIRACRIREKLRICVEECVG